MSEEANEGSVVDRAFGGQIDNDLMKKAGEAGLVETGRYRAVVEKWEVREQKEYFDDAETKPNPFHGLDVGSFTLRLGSKRDGKGAKAPFVTLDTKRVFFLPICTATVMSDFDSTKLTKQSKYWGWLCTLAAKDGVTANAEVIKWAQENAFEVSIVTYEAGTDEKSGRTWPAGTRAAGLYRLAEGE